MKKISRNRYLAACEILMCGAINNDRDIVATGSCSQFGWWLSPNRNGKFVWVELRVYDDRAFRLAAKENFPPYELQARFTNRKLEFPRYQFELSFAPQEIRKVAREFVQFVESAFTAAYWQWPLFAHDKDFPHYAWSKAGSKLFAGEEQREKEAK